MAIVTTSSTKEHLQEYLETADLRKFGFHSLLWHIMNSALCLLRQLL